MGVHSMPQVQENQFQTFCKLSQKVQKIQNQIQTKEVNGQTRVSLHHELESIQDQIEKLTESAAHASASFRQFEEMNRQIISLYREVEERFEEYEISLISKEAFALSKALENGRIFKVAKQVEELKHSIQFLFQHRRPSMQHRKIVNLAMKLSYEADDVVATMGKSLSDHLKFILKLRSLLKEAVQRANLMINPEEGELAVELYEIADLLESSRMGEGRMRLHLIRNRLTRAQRRRLDAASDIPREMIKILLEIAAGDPCIEWDERREIGSVICSLHA